MKKNLKDLVRELKANANAKKSATLAKYFKTGTGEYGAGDRFLGLTVPQQRTIARAYAHLSFSDLATLAKSPIHEHRFTCTEILQLKYALAKKSPTPQDSLAEQERLAKWYLEHARCFNNWDLVDNSARDILGAYLYQKGNTAILDRLARSANLWERRIAIISTYFFIQQGEFTDTIRICEILISDEHDLIHKACGWMLREIGKRSPIGLKTLRSFLDTHAVSMPRTMLRYAIERFSASQRAKYLRMA
ncbi:MAG: DNA alkylation repair protein [Patescibacteria group bacterium]